MLAIYTRLSKDDPDSNSPKNQLREGLAFAKSIEITSHQHYDEGIGVSGGSKIEDRPKLKELVEDIYAGLINAVWFRHQDRLERNTSTFLYFTDAVKKKKVKVYIGDSKVAIDYNDPNSFFQGGLMSMFNNYLIQKQSYLTANSIKKNFELGYVHGIPPYGYKKLSKENPKMVIDKEEEVVVKRIFKLSLEGNGYKTIANLLNEDKIPTRYNKIGKGKKKTDTVWSAGSIRGIIKNEIYKGLRKPKASLKSKKIRSYDTVFELDEAIIEPYYFDKVNANLKNNMNSSGKSIVNQYLLNNVTTCGVCGKRHTGRALQNKYVLYRCVTKRTGKHNCGNSSIRAKNLENIIWDIYFKNKHMITLINAEYDVDKDILIASEAIIEAGNYSKEKGTLIEQKKNLVIAVAMGNLKQKDIREVLDDIEIKLNNANAKMDELMTLAKHHQNILENHIVQKEELEDFLKFESFEEKQELIQKYIKDIVVTKLPNKHYKIYVHFCAENIESDAIIIDENYNWTYEPNRNHLVDSDGNHFDPETDVKMMQEIDKMFNYYEDLYQE